MRAAGSGDPAVVREALALLCGAYWFPLYAFTRRSGHSTEDAQDLVQGFFARFLQKDYLTDLGPESGRFRSYLLAALRNYMANERDRSRAPMLPPSGTGGRRRGGAPIPGGLQGGC